MSDGRTSVTFLSNSSKMNFTTEGRFGPVCQMLEDHASLQVRSRSRMSSSSPLQSSCPSKITALTGRFFLVVVVVVPECCLLVSVGAWCLLVSVGACWWCLLVVVVGVCVAGVFKIFGPLPRTPLRRTALRLDRPKFRSFCSLSRRKFLSFFSLWEVFSLNFGGVFEDRGAQMCTFGVGRRGSTRQPENSKRAHLSVPALQTPPKFHEKTPRVRRNNEISGGREQKKREILGPHPSAPTLRAPPFGPPTLRAPNPSGPQPFGQPTLRAPNPWGPQPFGPPTLRAPNPSGPTFSGFGPPPGPHPSGPSRAPTPPGPHPSGPPPLRAPTPPGPHPFGPPPLRGPHPFGPPPLRAPFPSGPFQKQNWPNAVWPNSVNKN